MLTRQLAEFVVDTRTTDIPAAVLKGSRYALADTLGCALAGTLEPAAELAAQWAQETGARAQATVWGRNLGTSPAEAAFANGIAGHALDFDDSLPSLRGHPSTTMGPAALAVGEATGALDTSLMNVTYFYNRDVKESVDKGMAMIGPVLTVVLGGMMVFIMWSVLGPVYDILGKIKF